MRNSASKDQRAIARERADTAKADRWVREAGHEPLPAAESSNPTERTGANLALISDMRQIVGGDLLVSESAWFDGVPEGQLDCELMPQEGRTPQRT